jgi:phage/plasmid-associated DNA primase
VKPTNYIFKANENIGDYFAEWKCAFMKIILESLEDVPEPIEVQKHTQKFQERESVVMRFVGETVERVETNDGKPDKKKYVMKAELWQNFKIWLKDEGEQIKMKKGEFYENLMKYMIDYRDDTEIKGKRVKGVFYGYKITDDRCQLSGDDYDP